MLVVTAGAVLVASRRGTLLRGVAARTLFRNLAAMWFVTIQALAVTLGDLALDGAVAGCAVLHERGGAVWQACVATVAVAVAR